MTTMTWDDLYAEGLKDCGHPERIEEAAGAVAGAILDRKPIEIALAPGNGTRYCWLFVPFDSCRKVPVGDYLESAGTAEIGVWIAQLRGRTSNGIYSLAFSAERDMPHFTYLSEKWFDGKTNYDLVVFYELIRLILEQMAAI